MRTQRLTAGLTVACAIAAIGLLAAACNDKGSAGDTPGNAAGSTGGSADSGKYCADLAGYVSVAKPDPSKHDEMLRQARTLAAEAPAELKDAWQVSVTYAENHRPPYDPKSFNPDESRKLMEASIAISKHAKEKCGVNLGI